MAAKTHSHAFTTGAAVLFCLGLVVLGIGGKLDGTLGLGWTTVLSPLWAPPLTLGCLAVGMAVAAGFKKIEDEGESSK